jgi:hypothetical protein
MSFRILTSIMAAFAALALQVAAQSPSVAAKPTAKAGNNWTPPRTPDGRPDLQGVWVSNSATPLERPKALEGKPLLTDAEVAELKKRAARLFKDGGASDFASGDNAFLAAYANVEQYKNPNISTGGSSEMIEREFDNRTSLIVDPPDGKIPPMTPAGQQRLATLDAAAAGRHSPTGPEDLTNFMRCITFGVPRLGGNFGAGPYSYYQILQTPEYVVFFTETIHEARIIPLDGRPHLPRNIRQWSGDSRGRWEGKTLVVDTTNFSPKSYFMGSAENLHLVERFTRISPDTLNYEVTLEDPTTWTKQWTAAIHLKQSQEAIYEFACHEGNYDTMLGILGAGHANEKAAPAAASKNK